MQILQLDFLKKCPLAAQLLQSGWQNVLSLNTANALWTISVGPLLSLKRVLEYAFNDYIYDIRQTQYCCGEKDYD